LELEASRHVVHSDLRGLRSFAEVCRRKHTPLVLYLGDVARKIERCDVLPWQEGLRRIGL
jgi:hypothetical protein